MTTVRVEDLTNLGSIVEGDKLLGERVDGTTVRITYSDVGTTTRTTVGTLTTGVWNATGITVPYGGSGRASATAYTLLAGGTTSTGAHQSLSAGTAGQILTSTGSSSLPTWTTASYPATTTANQLLYSSANNTIAGLSTGNNSVLITNGSGVPSLSTTLPTGLTIPGYQADLSLSYSNGGIVYSTASAAAVLAGTATANKMLLSGSSTTPSWSTSTIPTSAGSTANKVLLSDGTNYVLSTPTFPNASATTRKKIVSDGTNWIASTETWAVPGTSGNILQSDGTNWASATPTGSGAPVLAISPTLVTPNIGVATGASFNTITGVATQNNQEIATSITTVVTPGRQQYHPSASKAWVKFNASTGTPTINQYYNVTSLTDNGAGDFTVNYTVSFSSSDYALVISGRGNGGAPFSGMEQHDTVTRATNATRIYTLNSATPTDFPVVSVVCFGDQ